MRTVPGTPIVIADHLRSDLSNMPRPNLELLKAEWSAINKKGDRAISNDDVIRANKKVAPLVDSMVKRNGRGITPKEGQEFSRGLAGRHVKFSQSGTMALCWFYHKGKPHGFIDNHKSPSYGRFSKYQNDIKGGVAQSGSDERERKLAVLRKAGLIK